MGRRQHGLHLPGAFREVSGGVGWYRRRLSSGPLAAPGASLTSGQLPTVGWHSGPYRHAGRC